MARLKFGVVRYASVTNAIAHELGIDPPPDCRIGDGRTTLRFRQLGASRWTEARQADFALKVATIARRVFASDSRRAVRQRAGRAIVVVYEDAGLARGCSVVARWECVVTADATSPMSHCGAGGG
jgi:hypothetical protein